MKTVLLFLLPLLLYHTQIQTEQFLDPSIAPPSDFESLLKRHVEENYPFVDKTLFIREFLLNSPPRFILTRPPGWCKSMNLKMLDAFINIETDQNGNILNKESRTMNLLFSEGEYQTEDGKVKKFPKLKISQDRDAMQYQGIYPTFHLDLSTLTLPKDRDFMTEELVSHFSKYMSRILNTKYAYLKTFYNQSDTRLVNSDKENLQRCFNGTQTYGDIFYTMYHITKAIYLHFGNKPVYVLVDNYDSIFNDAFVKFGYKTEMVRRVLHVFTEIFRMAFNDNNKPHIAKVIFCGRLPVVLDRLDHFIFCSMASERFSQYYGFTEHEVRDLLNRTSLTEEQTLAIAEWYNGYSYEGIALYNPYSVVACLRNGGEVKRYWNCSGNSMDGYIKKILLRSDRKKDVTQLVNMQKVSGYGNPWNLMTLYPDYVKRVSDFPMLLHYGLVTMVSKGVTNSYYQVPNWEAKGIIEEQYNKTRIHKNGPKQ